MEKMMAMLLLVVLAVPLCAPWATAESYQDNIPYDTYNYTEHFYTLASPDGYLPEVVFTGGDMGTTALYNPADLFVDEAGGRIFIADSGNNRIVITDANLRYLSEIKTFELDGAPASFSNPTGVFCDEGRLLYVADKGNARVLRFSVEGEPTLDRVFLRPDTKLIDAALEYKPTKVSVSGQGNIYIIAEGMFEGIIEIDEDNMFQGFVGTNYVQPNLWQLFLRAISTREQKAAMRAFIPIEFLNMDIDEYDFIYATSQLDNNNSNSAVKRINPGGANVLTVDNNFMGDQGNMNAGRYTGYSQFRDICYLKDGIIACLDATRSRIFLYYEDHRAMFIFGESGNQKGHIMSAAAIDNQDDSLLVLDSMRGSVTVFRPTEYGATVLRAVSNYNKGHYDLVMEDYGNILRMNGNSEIAHSGIGKVLLRSGEYKEAMRHFETAQDKDGYSKAFKLYRNELLSQSFGVIFIVVVAALLCIIFKKQIAKAFRALRQRVWPEAVAKAEDTAGPQGWLDTQLESLEFSSYVMLHPFKGFWELKRERRGTLFAAIVILAVYVIVSVAKAAFSGFLFTERMGVVDTVYTAILALVPFILFVVSNWSFTTLMDGDGSFRDIVIATSYALLPFILIQIPAILLSRVLTLDEGVVLTVLDAITCLFIAYLIYVGNLTTHQYSAGRGVGMILLTLFGIAVIIFIGFLFVNLGYEVVGFIRSIVVELQYRNG